MGYVKTLNAFEDDNLEILCMIEDCTFNKDAICAKGLHCLSEQCDMAGIVPGRHIQKSGQKAFKSQDFIELISASSSKGNQKKFISKDKKLFIKMQFNYQGRNWNDDLVEVIASGLGTQFGFNCLQQYLGIMDGLDCSYSRVFDGKFIAYKRIDPVEQLYDYKAGTDQLKFAIDCIKIKTDVDCSRYFYQMLLLDYLVCNEDRHLYNFGILQKGDGCVAAPLFDFGLGLFEHDNVYRDKTLVQAEKLALKKPFGNQLPLIEWLEKEYRFCRPASVNLNSFIFPNKLAEKWLHHVLKTLEIKY
ncbi:MAG: hypothetical protein HFH68_01410 [Lachnospiraceae bacterium]|nr:hypothetical protein [Lachnospiraceae bacterium]